MKYYKESINSMHVHAPLYETHNFQSQKKFRVIFGSPPDAIYLDFSQ